MEVFAFLFKNVIAFYFIMCYTVNAEEWTFSTFYVFNKYKVIKFNEHKRNEQQVC